MCADVPLDKLPLHSTLKIVVELSQSAVRIALRRFGRVPESGSPIVDKGHFDAT